MDLLQRGHTGSKPPNMSLRPKWLRVNETLSEFPEDALSLSDGCTLHLDNRSEDTYPQYIDQYVPADNKT